MFQSHLECIGVGVVANVQGDETFDGNQYGKYSEC